MLALILLSRRLRCAVGRGEEMRCFPQVRLHLFHFDNGQTGRRCDATSAGPAQAAGFEGGPEVCADDQRHEEAAPLPPGCAAEFGAGLRVPRIDGDSTRISKRSYASEQYTGDRDRVTRVESN